MQRRQNRTNRVLGFMAIGLFFLTTGQAQAASGNGPYYAEPAWSQKLPAATRYVVLTDWNSEAVLDRETGLVWERSPSTEKVHWFFARARCASSAIGGRGGWRLPSFAELASLGDPNSVLLGLSPPFIFLDALNYWTATTDAAIPDSAWYGGPGSVFNVLDSRKDNIHMTWCVRGGMNAAVY